MSAEADATNERVLVHAPFGRDGLLIQEVLKSGGMDGKVCRTISDLRDCIAQGAGVAIVGDEALQGRCDRNASRRFGEPAFLV